jgi:hypothetical protein
MPVITVTARTRNQKAKKIFNLRTSGETIKTEYRSVKREGKTNLLYSTLFGGLFVEKFLIKHLPLGASFWNFLGV